MGSKYRYCYMDKVVNFNSVYRNEQVLDKLFLEIIQEDENPGSSVADGIISKNYEFCILNSCANQSRAEGN